MKGRDFNEILRAGLAGAFGGPVVADPAIQAGNGAAEVNCPRLDTEPPFISTPVEPIDPSGAAASPASSAPPVGALATDDPSDPTAEETDAAKVGTEDLPTLQARLAAEWDHWASRWFESMGHHAHELTGADQVRAAALEQRIIAAIVDGAERTMLELIAAWQRATTPLRWLPHGRWYADPATGERSEGREAVYASEADARGVGAVGARPATKGGRCAGEGQCGGACTGGDGR